MKWRWSGGDAFDQSALGTPDLDTAYSVCVYDMSNAGELVTLAFSIDLPPGPSWTISSTSGASYLDNERRSDGAQKLQLRTGNDGQTRATLKAGGGNLPLAGPVDADLYFSQSPAVAVQLIGSSGLCLSSRFDASMTRTNDGSRFSAKAP